MKSQTGGSGRPVRDARADRGRPSCDCPQSVQLSPCGPATADARVAKHNGHIEFNVQSGRFYPRPPMNGFIHIAMPQGQASAHISRDRYTYMVASTPGNAGCDADTLKFVIFAPFPSSPNRAAPHAGQSCTPSSAPPLSTARWTHPCPLPPSSPPPAFHHGLPSVFTPHVASFS